MNRASARPPAWPVDLDLPGELAAMLRQVPAGRVTTYGDLARALGHVSAARWVGEYLMDHPHDADCPCHRVIRSDGTPGLYIAGGETAKRSRLRRESVRIGDRCIDLSERFNAFRTSAPLRALTEFQHSVPARLELVPLRRDVATVAGIDIAYVSDHEAVAACVLLDAESLETIWSTTLTEPARFPYIPGYLTFREAPLMLRAWEAACAAGHAADVVFIDGNGYLHPRRAGIACSFGVLAGVPTIGVGKTLLCGRVDLEGMTDAEMRPVVHESECVGMAVKSGVRSRAVYVSPGNLIDLAGAAQLARRMMQGHRLPEPLHRADRLSKAGRRGEAVL